MACYYKCGVDREPDPPPWEDTLRYIPATFINPLLGTFASLCHHISANDLCLFVSHPGGR